MQKVLNKDVLDVQVEENDMADFNKFSERLEFQAMKQARKLKEWSQVQNNRVSPSNLGLKVGLNGAFSRNLTNVKIAGAYDIQSLSPSPSPRPPVCPDDSQSKINIKEYMYNNKSQRVRHTKDPNNRLNIPYYRKVTK